MSKIAVAIGDTFFGEAGHFLSDLPGLGQLVSLFTKNAISVAAGVMLFLFVIAGFKMVTAAGNAQKFQEGQNIITAAVLGFVVVLGAFLIVRLIESSLGVTILGA